MTNEDMKRYKYSAIAMVSVYIIITLIDMVKGNLSNQATIIFCTYMAIDQLVLFIQTKKIKGIVIAVIMALIIFLFLYDYVINSFILVAT